MTGLDGGRAVEVVTWLFLATNSARVLAYLPQIRSAWRCTNGATAVSRATWSCFALAHLCGALYGAVVVRDIGMAAVFLGNFAACTALVAVITWKRHRHRHACRPG